MKFKKKNSYTFFSELPFIHMETQHLHLAIPQIFALFTSAFASSSYSCPSELRNVCIKVLFLGSFKGMTLLLLSCRARKGMPSWERSTVRT